MATTVQIRKEELGKARNAEAFFSKLTKEHEGKWIAILENGEVVAGESLTKLYSEIDSKPAKTVALFHANKKGQLILR
jgi:hypothetical protein